MNWLNCFISLHKMFISDPKKKVEHEYLTHFPTGGNCEHQLRSKKTWPQKEGAADRIEGRSSEAFCLHKTELKTAQQSMKRPEGVEHNVGHASTQAEIQPPAVEGYKSPICLSCHTMECDTAQVVASQLFSQSSSDLTVTFEPSESNSHLLHNEPLCVTSKLVLASPWWDPVRGLGGPRGSNSIV